MSSSQYPASVSGGQPANLVDMVRLSAEQSPDQPVFAFLADSEGEERKLTCSALDQRARVIAAKLQVRSVKGPAMLFYNAGLEFVEAFFGCLYAGIVAVPAPVPRSRREFARWKVLVDDSGADIALAPAKWMDRNGEQVGVETLAWFATDEISSAAAQDWRPHRPQPDDLAYLQYTSGSTSAPKGVMISHANALHNLAYIAGDFRTTRESVLVSWLPHFHDMGLVYGIMAPVFGGFRCILMSPASFLQRPARWLQAISRYSATHSGGPNFAYDLCSQRVPDEDLQGLDLRSWRVAFNGAETVRSETLERFANRFRPAGFQKSSFYPAYGLAETTLKVSCKTNGEPVKIRTLAHPEEGSTGDNKTAPPSAMAKRVVSCGKAHYGMQVVVVNPETATCCREAETGEIWVAGPSVAQGYWRRPSETNATFRCAMAAFPGKTFLRTGDLGFLADGEIYVTGRMKGLIIIRGQNHYPQDIELSASMAHAEIRQGCCIAFSIEAEGEERLIVVCEMERNFRSSPAEVVQILRQSLTVQHGIQAYGVVLVRTASIPKTSSGKVQRGTCRNQFLNGSLNALYSDIRHSGPDLSAVETVSRRQSGSQQTVVVELREMVSLVLRTSIEGINLRQPLTAVGLDSLHAAELANRILVRWNKEISMADLLEGASINQLAEQIDRRGPAAPQPPLPANTLLDGKECLSLEQERLWFLERVSPGQGHHNLTAGIRLEGHLEIDVLEQSMQAVIRRNSVLRTSFTSLAGQPSQIIAPAAQCQLNVIDISRSLSPEEQILRESSLERSRAFDMERPPLLRAMLLRVGERHHVLLLTAHHIISDAHSMTVLAAQISAVYETLSRGGRLSSAECMSYAAFAERQRKQWKEHPRLDALSYWRTTLAGAPAAIQWPEMESAGPPEAASAVHAHCFEISVSQHENILAECRREGVTLFMWLLAAFKAALFRCTNQPDVVLGVPVSGRNGPEFDSVIGFFAHPVVIRTKIEEDWKMSDLLLAVRDEALAAYRHQDVPFSKLVEAVRPQRVAGRPALFQVMFSLIQMPGAILELPDLKITHVDLPAGTSDLDLFVSAVQRPGGTKIWLQYNSRLVSSRFVEQTASLFQEILLGSLNGLSTALASPAPHQSRAPKPLVITIAATFRSELIEKPLKYWMKNLHVPSEIRFTAYDQVCQELLGKDSQLAQNVHGVNILLVRLEDWEDTDENEAGLPSASQTSYMRGRIAQFVDALRHCSQSSAVLFMVQLCPPSPAYLERTGGAEQFSELEAYACSELAKLDRIYTVSSSRLAQLYPVKNFYDRYSDEHAQMPYTSAAFAALGTMAARLIYSLTRPPKKVIVVDCDGTLWGGICGEDGAHCVEIDGPRQRLQEFLIEQSAAGMLLCLCSRNNEADVWQVFDERPEMKLAKSHLASWRINWLPKSENLCSLATELNLGIDSMVFLDDDPKECHEVQLNCPGCVTIQLPEEHSRIPSFVEHLWALDHWKTTKEDRLRTAEYKNNVLREQIKQKSVTLEDFIRSLDLHVEIRGHRPEQLERMSQLTRRTNQFNMTMKQRSAAEIEGFLQHGDGLIVEVRDRFGDYGLVGVLLFFFRAETLVIDTFLLSCRALGRNIEHQMFNAILKLARQRQAASVDIEFAGTGKNAPALAFLKLMNPSILGRSDCVTQFRFFTAVSELPERAETIAAK